MSGGDDPVDDGPPVPRPEHPRPDFERDTWRSCNGSWWFAFDDDDCGLAEGWDQLTAGDLGPDGPLSARIVVPFAPQTTASGIGDVDRHDVAWYARVLPDLPSAPDRRVLLHIGASDHETDIWVNGRHVGAHEGGYTPVTADITAALTGHDDVCVIRVADDLRELDKPRGKQFWRTEPDHVFYTAVTGIWQSVWLETVHRAAVEEFTVETDLAAASVILTVRVSKAAVGRALRVRISLEGALVAEDLVRVTGPEFRRAVRLVDDPGAQTAWIIEHAGVSAWTPWDPNLYDLELAVLDDDGSPLDEVRSYFGMRTIDVRDGRVLLNGLPLYQRLVLDQGYFPEGAYTALDDATLRRDIELAKELGFIGCRKHQKIEDPRWLYWADRLGFLVWAELPSAHRFSPAAVRRSIATWQEAIARDRNHPCIIVWVPINESWGAPAVGHVAAQAQISYLDALYHLTKTLDPTRLVVSNDGWEHATTDLCTVHEYGDAETLRRRLATRAHTLDPGTPRRSLFAAGYEDTMAPMIVSEFGGISTGDSGGWGFHTAADGAALLARYRDFVAAVVAAEHVAGFCWTQLTDVEQETNGLLDADRRPKAPVEAIHAATTQKPPR